MGINVDRFSRVGGLMLFIVCARDTGHEFALLWRHARITSWTFYFQSHYDPWRQGRGQKCSWRRGRLRVGINRMLSLPGKQLKISDRPSNSTICDPWGGGGGGSHSLSPHVAAHYRKIWEKECLSVHIQTHSRTHTRAQKRALTHARTQTLTGPEARANLLGGTVTYTLIYWAHPEY